MAAKSLTKALIKKLGKELSETAFTAIAYANAGIPRSTYYFWKSQAEEIDAANPERHDLCPDEELLIEFLDTIEQSRAKAGKTLIDSAFKHARSDGNVAIKLIERLFPDDFAAPARREITIKTESLGDQNTGIANIPTLGGAAGQDLEALLLQQQSSAVDLAKSSTQARKPGDD